MYIAKIIFFCKCRRIRLKLVICLYYDLTACNKKANNLPLTIALIAHLRSQFNHVYALLITMPRLKALIFAKIGLKLSYFCKKMQSLRKLGALPLDPLAYGG